MTMDKEKNQEVKADEQLMLEETTQAQLTSIWY